jgi:hypothetical protein
MPFSPPTLAIFVLGSNWFKWILRAIVFEIILQEELNASALLLHCEIGSQPSLDYRLRLLEPVSRPCSRLLAGDQLVVMTTY